MRKPRKPSAPAPTVTEKSAAWSARDAILAEQSKPVPTPEAAP